MDIKMLIRWIINQSDEEILKLLTDMKDTTLSMLNGAPSHVKSFLAMPCSVDVLKIKVLPIIQKLDQAGISVDYSYFAKLSKNASLESVLIFLINTLANTFSIDSNAPDAIKFEVLNNFKTTLGGLL